MTTSTSGRSNNFTSEGRFRRASENFVHSTIAYVSALIGLTGHYLTPLFDANFRMVLGVMVFVAVLCLIFGYPVVGSRVPRGFYKLRAISFWILVVSFVVDCIRFYFFPTFEYPFVLNHIQLVAVAIFTIAVWIYDPASLVKNQS